MVSSFSILLVFSSLLVNNASAIRCYVCGNEKNEVSCDEFQDNENFIKECESEYQACSMTKKATQNEVFSRSCARIRLTDCKTANEIEYCYCTENLCNLQVNSPTSESDDEDFIEGSGTFHTTTDQSLLIPKITEKPSLPAKIAKSSCCVSYHSFKTVLIFCMFLIFLNFNE